MNFFEISKELQFRASNHGEPCASQGTAREGELFYRGKKEVGRAIVNKESMAFHWLRGCQERRGVFFLVGSAILTGHERSPFWSLNLV